MLTLQNYFSVLFFDPESVNKIEETSNSIQVHKFHTNVGDVLDIDGNVQANQRPTPQNNQCNITPEVLKENLHINERYVEDGIVTRVFMHNLG